MVGLVLEGGAMRGLFTAGVLDVLMENGIQTDGVIGVSAGAVFGCNFQSRQQGRTIRYNLRFCREWRYCSLRSLLLTGDLYGARFCYDLLPNRLDPFDRQAFAQNPTPFYVVCTDVDTGMPVYHRCSRLDGEEMEWLRASASMPLASRVVRVGGKRLLDGGIADSIPIRFFESLGYRRNIVVLTQPEGFCKKPTRAALLLRGQPRVAEALSRRHTVYNETLAYIGQREREGDALVIRPPQRLPIGHIEHHADRMQQVYEIGLAEGQKRLAELRAFLAQP